MTDILPILKKFFSVPPPKEMPADDVFGGGGMMLAQEGASLPISKDEFIKKIREVTGYIGDGLWNGRS